MQCPDDLEDLPLSPQDPAGLEVQARLEAHARGCRRCAERLASSRAAEGALASWAAARRADAAGACPEPEALATWLDARESARDGALEVHLAACAECRQDALAVARTAEQLAELVAPPARRTRTPWLVGAVAAAVAAVVALTVVPPSSGGRQEESLRANAPAPRAPTPTVTPAPPVTPAPAPTVDAPTPTVDVPAPPTPRRAPRVDSSTPVFLDEAPALDELDAPSIEDAPTPTIEAPTPAIDAPAPTVDAPSPPPPVGPPAPSTGTSTRPAPRDPIDAGPPLVALGVHDAWGVQRRRAGADDWSLVASGPLADGDSLRVSTSGGVLWTTRGAVFLAPRARASVAGELMLDAGKAVLEGAGQARLRTPDGVVIADGQALVEVRRGRTSVAALRGHLACVQDGRRVEVAAGHSTRMTRAEIAPPEDLRDAAPPAWLELLRGHARPPRPLGPGGPPPGPGPGPGGPPPGPGPGAPRGGPPPGPVGPPPGPHGPPPPPRPDGGGSPGAIHPRGSPT